MKIEKRMQVINICESTNPMYITITLQDQRGNEVFMHWDAHIEYPRIKSYMTVTISNEVEEEQEMATSVSKMTFNNEKHGKLPEYEFWCESCGNRKPYASGYEGVLCYNNVHEGIPMDMYIVPYGTEDISGTARVMMEETAKKARVIEVPVWPFYCEGCYVGYKEIPQGGICLYDHEEPMRVRRRVG